MGILSRVTALLVLLVNICSRAPTLVLPELAGEDLHAVVLSEKATSGGLDGWGWNELKALPLSWYVGLALVLRQVDGSRCWPQGLLDAYITMIPKADGDSALLGQRPLCVLPVVYRLWASVGLSHFQDWFYSNVTDAVKSAGKEYPALMPGMRRPWILRRCSVELMTIMSTYLWLMLLCPSMQYIGGFWIVLLAGWVVRIGLGKFTFLTMLGFD